jgi:Uma2 family endonuclease
MDEITDFNQLDLNGTYTYSDYATWKFRERVELLWGKIKKMSAAPSTRHQQVLGELFVIIKNILKGNRCQAYIAPFDVRLPLDENSREEVKNVVQPDITIICDSAKVDENGCFGPPDLVIEVISPTSSKRDLKEKLNLYEQAGIAEYWVVDPYLGIVQVFIAETRGKYRCLKPVTAGDIVRSVTIPGLEINMTDIFPDILKESEEPYGHGIRRW